MKARGLETALKLSGRTNRPIASHFWIVQYRDGKAMAQFDPDTLDENAWWAAMGALTKDDYHAGNYTQAEISSVTWIPFSEKLARRLRSRDLPAIHVNDSTISIEIGEGDVPYARRETTLKIPMNGPQLRFVRAYKLGKNVGTDYEILESMKILEGIEFLPKT